jgi:hypothetical protein
MVRAVVKWEGDMKNCTCLVVLCLIVFLSTGAAAVPVTPGGLVVDGQMYITGDPLDGTEPAQQWVDFVLPPTWEEPGDPLDMMYHSSTEIGIRDGICSIPLGNYESAKGMMLGHVIHTMDFTIRTTTIDNWSESGNLLFQLLSPDATTVY